MLIDIFLIAPYNIFMNIIRSNFVSEKYYTAEQAAEMMKMHIKTVQRYIREGRLKANKVGKSWRITGHDLSVLLEGEQSGKETPPHGESNVQVSAVADILAASQHDAIRIMNTLTALSNAKPREEGPSSLTVQYLESEHKVRAMIYGSIGYVRMLLDSIAVLAGEDE